MLPVPRTRNKLGRFGRALAVDDVFGRSLRRTSQSFLLLRERHSRLETGEKGAEALAKNDGGDRMVG